MLDISKIKVGDEVTVRGVVTHKVDMPNPKFGLCFSKPQDKSWCNVEAYAIVTHTPAPRAFKPGDTVYAGSSVKWRIEHLKGHWAWIEDANKWIRLEALENLRHADESE